jgi:hypothetical protein
MVSIIGNMKRTALKNKPSKLRKLIKEADKLFQEKYIQEKPKSAVSGKPTEIIHHFIPKGQSNNLRYDEKNAVPLTKAEHFAYHTKGDPEIVTQIVKTYGVKWYNDLQMRRRITCKFNIGYLETIIRQLTQINRN